MLLHFAAALAPLLLPAPISIQAPMPEEEIIENLSAMTWLTGEVTVEGGMATINLPEGWTYLDTMDARFMVENIWGNPEDKSTLGLVSPPGEESWAVIVSFDEDGYVSDKDAGDIDFDDLMDGMKSDEDEINRARTDAGYETISILGWAEKPHYDSVDKKLYWAKRLEFGQTPGVVLNYDVRILGRRGTLVMQAVATDDELSQVAEGCKLLLQNTAFTKGNRYEEFDSSIDKLAVYGIGGLIAGKALLKIGIFAKFGKLIMVGLVVVFGAVKKFFFGKQEAQERPRRRRVRERD